MTSHATAAAAEIPEEETAEPALLDHAYDGIREYDNPLPGWWSAVFWSTIVFAIAYAAAYHAFGWLRTPDAKYREALAIYESRKSTRDAAEAASVNEQVLAKKVADPKVLAEGKAIFETRCATCHTATGVGLIGPNLTDHFQIHGESRMDIFTTVKRGVPGTAMLAWGEQLPAGDVLAAAAYAISLRGQDLPGKAREGHQVRAFVP
jgi:cytochrome c oxidase cbb3-type subunit 3